MESIFQHSSVPRCGLVFDHLGHPWSRSDTQKACRPGDLGDAEDLLFCSRKDSGSQMRDAVSLLSAY